MVEEEQTHDVEVDHGVAPQPNVQISASAAAVVASTKTLAFTEFESNNWRLYWSSYPMSNSQEMEAAQDLIATNGLPEVFYGNNHLYLVRPDCNFLFEVSAVDAVSFASHAHRQTRFRDAASQATIEVNVDGEESLLNLIDVIPKKVLVSQA